MRSNPNHDDIQLFYHTECVVDDMTHARYFNSKKAPDVSVHEFKIVKNPKNLHIFNTFILFYRVV